MPLHSDIHHQVIANALQNDVFSMHRLLSATNVLFRLLICIVYCFKRLRWSTAKGSMIYWSLTCCSTYALIKR